MSLGDEVSDGAQENGANGATYPANGSHPQNGVNGFAHQNGEAASVQVNGVHSGAGKNGLHGRENPQSNSPRTELNTSAVEPIAIIGLGCRLPGGANTPEQLWNMLCAGASAWSPGPKSRYNMEAFSDPKHGSPDTTNACGGHFLSEDIAAFDASFFGIAPHEAKAIDPQQRLMLETAYEAFENAGMSTRQLNGSNTGVYVGQWASDYQDVLSRDTEYTATYNATGTGPAITSNRISYQLNLKGPSFTVDTGCSAGFVALHVAIQSLRSRETDVSLVGGVSVMADIQRFAYMSKLQMLNNDGRSYTFDSRAQGYGRGEGCCAIVLKPLSAALRDNDNVRGVIRNCVLNSDGKTSGIGTPSGPAQEAAITKAYADSGLDLDPDYAECHGTGTQVGDSVEVAAVAAVLGSRRDASDKLLIGSVKANIGHTESAASLAGLMKSILMLEYNAVPPQINYETPNPALLLDQRNVRVPTKLEYRELKRISINSFGYGGTNAHVVLDAPPNDQKSMGENRVYTVNTTVSVPRKTSRPRLFILSAASEQTCQHLAQSLAKYVSEHAGFDDPESWMDRLAYTLNRRSLHYRYRLLLCAADSSQLVHQLRDVVQKPMQTASTETRAKVALLFSGQGAQYFDMARGLIHTWPTFTQSLNRSNQLLSEMGCLYDVFEELRRSSEESNVDNPSYGQPLTTAIQLALVDALSAVGLSWKCAVGHSSGEIAAAYASDLISFEDATRVSYHRGRLTAEHIARPTSSKGAMLAAGVSAQTMEEYLSRLGGQHRDVEIACFNSPSSVTVSGDAIAIDELSKLLEADSKFNRKLRTRGAAYHSHRMRQIQEAYRESLSGVTWRQGPAQVRMYSSLTGRELEDVRIDRDYWVRNLVSPVLFSDAIATMCRPGKSGARALDVIVEVGPHPQLAGAVKQTIQSLEEPGGEISYVPTLDRKLPAEHSLLNCLGQLFSMGVSVDLHLANNAFNSTLPALLTDVPAYPFDHSQSFWHESRLSKDYKHRVHLPHPLLGNLSPDVNRVEPRWRRYLSLDQLPWLRSHVVQGQIVFPAAAYLTMAVEAMRRHKFAQDPHVAVEACVLRNISMGNALVITDDMQDLEVTFSLRPEPRSSRSSARETMEFRVFTVDSQSKWVERCRGSAEARIAQPAATTGEESVNLSKEFVSPDAKPIEQSGSHQRVSPTRLYHHCRSFGVDWQKPFDNITSCRANAASSVSVVNTPETDTSDSANQHSVYFMHPGTLDACLFHGLLPIMHITQRIKSAIVPNFIEEILITSGDRDQPGRQFDVYCKTVRPSQVFDVVVGEKTATGVPQALVLEAKGIHIAELPGDLASALEKPSKELCHMPRWVTYCEKITPSHLRTLCDSDRISAGSRAEQIRYGNAVIRSHVKNLLEQNPAVKVADDYRQYYLDWMKSLDQDAADNAVLQQAATRDHAELGVHYEAIGRVASLLPEFLAGEVDPLTILTHNNILARMYGEDHYTRCHAQVALYCAELGRENPNMKILEIGAGTGSVTLPILQELHKDGLQSVSEYHYTDISPGFFEAAKKKLDCFSSVLKYQALNIEKEPSAQGFEEGAYDLVVATSVIHATSDVSRALRNTRSLLRPGGTFILVEWTEQMLINGFIFGVFEGWWAGYHDGRKLSPVLTEQAWSEMLDAAGFDQTEVRFRDYADPESRSLSAFAAKAIESERAPSIKFDIRLIGLASETDFLGEIAGFLTRSDYPVRVVSLHETSSADVDAQSKQILSVFSPEVCEAFGGSMDETSWLSFRRRLLSSHAALMLSRGGAWDAERPCSGLLEGFCRTLRVERSDLRLISLDLDPVTVDAGIASQMLLNLLQSASFDLSTDPAKVDLAFAERSEQLFVSRVLYDSDMDDRIYRTKGLVAPQENPFLGNNRTLIAGLGVPGLLETFRWKDAAPVPPQIGPDDVKVELRAASINFKDVLIASGQLPGVTEMRNDCSGVVVEVGQNMQARYSPGDRVCCYYSNSYTNYPVLHGDCCAKIPDSLDFETAASLPIVWGTAYYSLVKLAQLQENETILIHSGAGAVGQAAISIAQHLGADIFVTAGSKSKREFLETRFGIAPDHIFSSRSIDFGPQIRKLSQGRGVDVVLNSLSGDLFRESCNTIAAYGRFVEIGKKDFLENALMPTAFLLRNVKFSYVDFGDVIEDKKALVQTLLLEIVDLIASGTLRLTTLTILPISEIENAFRQIQAGKHVGKIILTVAENQRVQILPPAPVKAQLKPNALYVIVGGLGGLGKGLISWMAQHGARNLMTLSRSGAVDEESTAFIAEHRNRGVIVTAEKCDVSSEEEFKGFLSQIAQDPQIPPIRGVINAAMVLEDVKFEDMTYVQWMKPLRPKVMATWNLHNHLPSDLDFFILFSSVTAAAGSQGQSNYAAGNSFQDAFAHFRASKGLPAHSFNIGLVVDAGFVSEHPEVERRLVRQGYGKVMMSELFPLVNHAITHPVAETPDASQHIIGLAPDRDALTFIKDRRFGHMRRRHLQLTTQVSDSAVDLIEAIRAESDLDQVRDLICHSIIQQLGRLIGLPAEKMSPSMSLDEVGVDSLVAVELKNWISAYLQANIPILVVRETKNIQELANAAFEESRIVAAKSS